MMVDVVRSSAWYQERLCAANECRPRRYVGARGMACDWCWMNLLGEEEPGDNFIWGMKENRGMVRATEWSRSTER